LALKIEWYPSMLKVKELPSYVKDCVKTFRQSIMEGIEHLSTSFSMFGDTVLSMSTILLSKWILCSADLILLWNGAQTWLTADKTLLSSSCGIIPWLTSSKNFVIFKNLNFHWIRMSNSNSWEWNCPTVYITCFD
jgi:hypothetical protein